MRTQGGVGGGIALVLGVAVLALPAPATALPFSRSDLDVPDEPYGVVLAELGNTSGLPEIITPHRMPQSVSVRRGDTLAAYLDPVSRAVGKDVVAVAVGDVTGDGDADAVTANFFSDSISVLPGDGADALGAPTHLTAGARPTDIALADLNGDLRTDIVVANKFLPGMNTGTGEVSVVLANATGGFGAATTYAAGGSPEAVEAADLDGDGDRDVALGTAGTSSTVAVLLNDGSGTLGAPTATPAGRSGLSALALTDLDDDGAPDLVVAGSGSSDPADPQRGIAVLLGDGDGGFAPATPYPTDASVVDVAAGDVDGDLRPDVAFTRLDNRVVVMRGDGEGGLEPFTDMPTGGFPNGVAIGDMLPADDKVDVAVANRNDDDVSRYLNVGEPTFSPDPGAIAFGTHAVGAFTDLHHVDVTNDGEYALRTTAVNVDGADADDFFADGADCIDRPVGVGETCRISVRFRADAARPHEAKLHVFHSADGSPSEIPLTGAGATSQQPPPDDEDDPANPATDPGTGGQVTDVPLGPGLPPGGGTDAGLGPILPPPTTGETSAGKRRVGKCSKRRGKRRARCIRRACGRRRTTKGVRSSTRIRKIKRTQRKRRACVRRVTRRA